MTAAAVLVLTLCVAGPEAPAPNVLEEARQAYLERSETGNARLAYQRFLDAAEADPDSYEARWEGARAAYFLGEFAMEDASDKQKIELYEQAMELARQAIDLREDGVEGHFWLGVLYGVYGEARGILKSLGLAPEIRREMERCLELDPACEGHGPDRVLGRLYYRLPWFKGGDNEKSLEHLRRSLEGTPTNALTRLYLAETLKSEGEKGEAGKLLEQLVSMEADPRWEAEHPQIVEKARKLLRKLR